MFLKPYYRLFQLKFVLETIFPFYLENVSETIFHLLPTVKGSETIFPLFYLEKFGTIVPFSQ
jgi:hypothetical protein